MVKYYTVPETAKMLGIHPKTLLLWLAEGKVKSTWQRPSGRHVFSRDDIDKIKGSAQ